MSLLPDAWLDLVEGGKQAEDLAIRVDDRVLELGHLFKHAVEDLSDRLASEEVVLQVRAAAV